MTHKSKSWFTSPWNEASKDSYNFSSDIKVHDVSLRDGEQQAGIALNTSEKLRLAEQMAKVGIHRIEAGMPVVSKQDEKAIKSIVKENFGPEIFAFGRCMEDDVKRAKDCGVDGIVIEIPSNEMMIKEAYKWDLEKAVDLSIRATTLAKELGLYTVFFPIDMTRASMGWVAELVKRVSTEGHMDALAIVDTFGGLNPHAIPHVVNYFKKSINKPIEVHFHDDFGLGSANSLMGLAAGADVVHTTISGAGERAGNAAYEDIVLSLLTMYGIDLGLKYDEIYTLSKMFREMTGLSLRQNQGIVGDKIFEIESGIVAAWHDNVKDENPLLLSPFLPELVGQNKTEVILGKHCGLPNVEHFLNKTDFKLSDDKKQDLLQLIKNKAIDQKEIFDLEKFKNLVSGM